MLSVGQKCRSTAAELQSHAHIVNGSLTIRLPSRAGVGIGREFGLSAPVVCEKFAVAYAGVRRP